MCATRYEVAMTLTLSPAAVILSSPLALYRGDEGLARQQGPFVGVRLLLL